MQVILNLTAADQRLFGGSWNVFEINLKQNQCTACNSPLSSLYFFLSRKWCLLHIVLQYRISILKLACKEVNTNS